MQPRIESDETRVVARRAPRSSALARATQIVDYGFGVLYTLIGFEFVLEVFAARDRNAFKRFLDAATDPFLGPFRTLLPTFAIGGSELIASYLVALVAYVMLHVGIHRIARMVSEPPPSP